MTLEDLWRGFCDPPDEARPRAWWHWMDGNVDPEGIRLDLEWLHRVGVRGVQMFDGGMGTPLVVPGAGAARVAGVAGRRPAGHRRRRGELGLEFAVATSAGWSAAGGPWVEPADAMKKVVWSTTSVDGGGPVEQPLAPLPDVAGPYQDCPRWGADPRRAPVRPGLGGRWPYRPTRSPQPLAPSSVTGSAPWRTGRRCSTASFAGAVSLPRDPDGCVDRLARAGLRRAGHGRRGHRRPARAARLRRPRRRRPRCWRPATTASPTGAWRSWTRRATPTRRCRCAPSRSRR